MLLFVIKEVYSFNGWIIKPLNPDYKILNLCFTLTLLHVGLWQHLTLLHWLKKALGLGIGSSVNCIWMQFCWSFLSLDENLRTKGSRGSYFRVYRSRLLAEPMLPTWKQKNRRRWRPLFSCFISSLFETLLCLFGDSRGTPASSTSCSPTCKYWSKKRCMRNRLFYSNTDSGQKI